LAERLAEAFDLTEAFFDERLVALLVARGFFLGMVILLS
jgi:hypothetical protein